MTMHLLPAFMTTTSTRKRKSKMTGKAKLHLAAHEQWINKMTGGKKSNKKVLDKLWKTEYNTSMMVDRSNMNKTGITSGVCSKPDEKVYSGELKLIGIATMHKSNMVPVFSKATAEEISKMRRG